MALYINSISLHYLPPPPTTKPSSYSIYNIKNSICTCSLGDMGKYIWEIPTWPTPHEQYSGSVPLCTIYCISTPIPPQYPASISNIPMR